MTVSNDEILSESEIESRFPDQWVLVDVLDWDAELHIARGIVRESGDDQNALHQAARQLPAPRKISIFHTGGLVKGQNYLLNHGLFL